MIKQKRGFWLFIFSLIPGAGEMYMGFRKQGISIMLLFWGIIALAAGLNMGWFMMFLPILWFYSFFNVHNLKCLSPEEFYTLEDRFILNLDSLLGESTGTEFMKKYRHIIGLGMIVMGACVLWNILMDFFWNILPYPLANLARGLSYRLPQGLFAVAIVLLGIYLIRGKKKSIEDTYYKDRNEDSQEHYWEPYRPSQQPPYSQETQEDEARPQTFSRESAPHTPSTENAPKADSPKENPDVILIPPTHGEEMNGHENP